MDDQYDNEGTSLSVKITSAQPVTENFIALCQEAVILLNPSSQGTCHLINPTSQPITIYAGFHIANMSSFEPHTIDAAHRCTDTTCNGEEQFDEIHVAARVSTLWLSWRWRFSETTSARH